MTTPTLVDAARATADALEEVEGHVGAYLWEGFGYADDLAALRAAIDREAERQEIIEGLVEAAREYATNNQSGTIRLVGGPEVWPAYMEGEGEFVRCFGCHARLTEKHPEHRGRCLVGVFTAALARYDAMKEDDRG